MSRNADFTPSRGEYKSLTPFRYWCQKVLPLVYDDALSYYELLCKVVDYLNKTMEDTETLNDDVTNLYTAYQELQEWVNDYYESADFEQAIDAGLDRMAESGQLTTLINAIIAPQLPDIVDLLLPETVLTLLPDEVHSQLPGVVEDQIDDVVEDQIGSTVAGQIGSTVANQISPVVANQLPGVVSNQIDAVVAEEIVDPVEVWLFTNVTGSNAIDKTLSIVGAGADSGFTGARIKTLDSAIGYEHISDNLPIDTDILDGQNILTDNHYAGINAYDRLETDMGYSAGTGNKARKILYIPVTSGEKYLINTHKLTNTTTGTLFTYAICTVYQPDPGTDLKLFDVANYGEFDSTGVFSGIVTIPDVVIPSDHVANMLYLVVETANIEDPVYKVTEPQYLVNQDQLDDAVGEVSDALDEVSETVSDLSDDVADKADEDGTYPYMTVGMAEQLLSDESVTDKKPYLFRRTGADATREYDTLVGGSVVANQLYNKMFPQSNTVNGITFTVNDDGSITANGTSTNTVYYQISDYMSFNNHVAYLSGCPSGGSAETYRIYLDTTPFSDTGNGCIEKLTIESKRFFINIRTGVTVNNVVFRPQIIDLTKMLPSAIADYAYTLEQSTAGSGIAWLKSYGFFTGYQAYNVGSMEHVSGVSAHVTKDANDNIIGNYALDSSLTLRGIPKLSNGEIYYDGDTYEHDGTVTRRYALVDLGTLNWTYATAYERFISSLTPIGKGNTINGLCSIYHVGVLAYADANRTDMELSLGSSGNSLLVRNFAYTDPALFKAAMSGIMLLYELATPTTESATPYQSPQICDPDGTEQYITDGIPVGHTTDYPTNLKGEIERVIMQVPKAPTTNGVYTLQCTVSSEGVLYEWKENS